MSQPKILVFTVPSWNSRVGANSWATLLEKYDSANIANVCIRDEIPDSKVCSRYFAISENKIIKSLFNKKVQTGREVERTDSAEVSKDLEEHNERYRRMKQKRRYSMLLLRELIWKMGKWRTRELDEFLDDFAPDIILHSMDGYIHLNRMIEYAIKRTGAKAIGYVWDDNFTYKQSDALGYKIYRFFQRGSLKRLARKTDAFFAISDMTKKETDEFFKTDSTLLTKPLNSTPAVSYAKIEKPIRMLYTGNLFIGRDKSLIKVIDAVKKLPEGSFFIDVYTSTALSPEDEKRIDPRICEIHAPIPQSEVLKKQKDADVLLFLEDIDGPDARVARLSFSTKTTDYLSAGKCIFAVGNTDTAPMQYFINNNAAVTATSTEEILEGLKVMLEEPEKLKLFAEAAMETGIKNHDKEKILKTFDSVISSIYQNKA